MNNWLPNPITIVALNAGGSGTAQLECADNCAITFSIQVSPDRSMMSLVTVSPGDPDDMLAGVAIRRSTGSSITRPNLAGRWQGTLFVEELDGDVASALVKVELNTKGKTISSSIVAHDTEGDNTSTGASFNVTVNPDGSGTLKVSCGEGCTVTFQLQVSPDRSTMTIADVSSATEDLLIGVLIHQ